MLGDYIYQRMSTGHDKSPSHRALDKIPAAEKNRAAWLAGRLEATWNHGSPSSELSSARAAGIRREDGAGLVPTVRELARHFGCGSATVCQALALLALRGILRRPPGSSRYSLAGMAEDAAAAATEKENYALALNRRAADALAEILRAEVLQAPAGALGKLPPFKKLRARYACGSRTLEKALGLLRRDGWIRKEGRSFVPAIRRGARRGSRIHLLCGAQLFRRSDSPIFLFLRAVEEQARRLGWPEVAYLQSENPKLADLPSAHQVSGYIYVGYHGGQAWSPLLTHLGGLPLVVANFGGHERLTRFRKSGSVIGIKMDHFRAGQEMGQHLAALGHRRVAFFAPDPFDSQLWAGRRWRGFQSVFGSGGGRHGLHVTLYVPRHQSRVAGGSRELGTFVKRMKTESPLPPSLVEDALTPAWELLGRWRIWERMAPLFESVLKENEVTAWVCLNDELAALAHGYLTQRGVDVPGRISLAGFDNSALAYRLGMTSYDFDFSAMGHQAVAALATLTGRRINLESEPVAGRLVSRRSTGPDSGSEPEPGPGPQSGLRGWKHRTQKGE